MTTSAKTLAPFPSPNQPSLTRFYGRPWKMDSKEKLVVDRAWEAANITRVRVPFALYMGDARIINIAIHRRLVDSVKEILNDFATEFTEKERAFFGLDQYGGGFNFREKRGSVGGNIENLSLHAYGAALDFSPLLNPLGKAYNTAEKMMPIKAIEIFKKRGWKWGGEFKRRPDCQHFEATS